MRNVRFPGLLGASRIALAVLFVGAPAALGDEFSKSDLLGAWEANWSPVQTLEVEYEHVNQAATDDQWAAGLIPRVEYVYRWSDGQYYSKMTRDNGVTHEVSYDQFAGEARRYNSGMTYGWVRSGRPYDGGAEEWGFYALRTPHLRYIPEWDMLMDLTYMLASDRSQLRSGLEDVRGRSAAVLDVFAADDSIIMTVWMDVERGAVPLRWVQFKSLDRGTPTATVDLSDYIQIEGAWLPRQISLTYGGHASGLQTIKRVLEDDQGRPRIRVNDPVAESPTVEMDKKGTIVIDEDNREWWIVSDHANTLSQLIDRVIAVTNVVGRPNQPSLESRRISRSRSGEVTVAILVFGSVLGCVLGLARRS